MTLINHVEKGPEGDAPQTLVNIDGLVFDHACNVVHDNPHPSLLEGGVLGVDFA